MKTLENVTNWNCSSYNGTAVKFHADNYYMIAPYGNTKLVTTFPSTEKKISELRKFAKGLKSFAVPDRFLSDCEMFSTGAFTPLNGFMNRDQVNSVLKRLTLPEGFVWGVPIVLPLSQEQASRIKLKEKITLLDSRKTAIALMLVTDKFRYNQDTFCKGLFGTTSLDHPGVRMIKTNSDVFLAGSIELLRWPRRNGIDKRYYLTPLESRLEFKKRGWKTIVAFHTRNPLHRAHEFLVNSALKTADGVFLHPLIGETKSDDVPAGIRMKCYEALIDKYFKPNKVLLSALPASMCYAGPREALHHAIIRRNYGCTHFIVGRDHAGIGNFYGKYQAQKLLTKYAGLVGIRPVTFKNVFYCRMCAKYATSGKCLHSSKERLYLSGTKVREMLREGIRPPLEFSRKEVVDVLMSWAKKQRKISDADITF